MAGITIVGLGPGSAEHLTVQARRTLRHAGEVYVRTRRHPTVAHLPRGLKVHSFDDVYDSAERIDLVYQRIAEAVVDLADGTSGVTYAVPGHPLVAEESVRQIQALAAKRGIDVRIIAGVSFLEPVFTLLGVDPLSAGIQVLDAHSIVLDYFGPEDQDRRDPFAPRTRGFDATRPLLLCQVENRRLASALKLVLLDSYPAQHWVSVVRSAGVSGRESVEHIPLHDLDRASIDHLTSVYLGGLPPLEDLSAFEILRHIIARLRAPGGCPWDRQQTHASLVKDLVEETYEAVDAIERGNSLSLAEELGDVLLNVVLQAQIGEEAGTFSLEDALRSVNTKLIRRHPHVFGDVDVSGAGEVLRNWDQIKRAEKGNLEEASRLGDIPLGLPSLSFAQKIQGRAERAGFAWSSLAPIEAKIDEELAELRASNADERVVEFGDFLFMLAKYAQALDVDAEAALRAANRKFISRFRVMEGLLTEKGTDFSRMDIDAKLALWEEAKRVIAHNSAGEEIAP